MIQRTENGNRGDNPTREAFLESFRKDGNVSNAARSAGVNRCTAYKWRDSDPVFAEAWADAEAQAGDRIRKAVDDRAIEGWLEPVFYQGEECGHVRKYSDTLLLRLAEARCSEFKRRVEIDLTIIEKQARKLAEENGLDADELIREAVAIATGEKAP